MELVGKDMEANKEGEDMKDFYELDLLAIPQVLISLQVGVRSVTLWVLHLHAQSLG